MYDRIWDPLYGRTKLTEFEARLIALPEIQRLRYIRMCNINSLLVTGASEISRFEHTLGVLRLAQEWARANNLDRMVRDDLLAAAILHDVQTGPYGHSFQYVLEDSCREGDEFSHDDLSGGAEKNFYMNLPIAAQFAGKPFRAPQVLKERWHNVASMIEGKGPLGPIIAGTMDLDNLDNVVRLAYHVGVADRRHVEEVLRIVGGIRPGDKTGSLKVTSGIVPDIESWQTVRKRLYELLLLDWAEFSAKAMLTTAVEEAIDAQLLGTNSWSHTDDGFLRTLERDSIGESQRISHLINRLRTGDLYSPIVLLRSNNTEMYSILAVPEKKREIVSFIEKSILRKIGVSRNVIFHVILDVAKTERAIWVEVDGSEPFALGVDSRCLLVGIFLSRPLASGSKSRGEVCNRIREYLSGLGMGFTEPLVDPMASEDTTEDKQLSLI